MKCPHCRVEIHPEFTDECLNRSTGRSVLTGVQPIGSSLDRRTTYHVSHMACPACQEAIIHLHQHREGAGKTRSWLVYPKGVSRAKAPQDVPSEMAADFNEACLVLSDSPKASAALSRRCLQHLLRAQGYSQHDLAKAIDAVLSSKTLPGALAESLDAVRNIGNFAAHPLKDTNSGAILDVEPEEAEWNLEVLEVLEGLFDFYYVQPAKAKQKISALNKKLAAAGKPPIKG